MVEDEDYSDIESKKIAKQEDVTRTEKINKLVPLIFWIAAAVFLVAGLTVGLAATWAAGAPIIAGGIFTSFVVAFNVYYFNKTIPEDKKVDKILEKVAPKTSQEPEYEIDPSLAKNNAKNVNLDEKIQTNAKANNNFDEKAFFKMLDEEMSKNQNQNLRENVEFEPNTKEDIQQNINNQFNFSENLKPNLEPTKQIKQENKNFEETITKDDKGSSLSKEMEYLFGEPNEMSTKKPVDLSFKNPLTKE
jgi:hypothetical protein